MRRTIKHRHLKPLLFGYEISFATNAPVASIGENDVGSFTDNGAGDATLAHKKVYPRSGLVVGTIGTVGSDGGFLTTTTADNGTSVRFVTRDGSGTAEEGNLNLLALTYDDPISATVNKQSLKNSRVRPVLLALQVDGEDGSPAKTIGGSELASITDNGVGDYTLNFGVPFASAPVVVATSFGEATVVAPMVQAKGVASAQLRHFTEAGVAVEAKTNALVLGWMSADEQHNMRRSVKSHQRHPRLVAGRVTVSGGAGTAAINTQDYTVTDPVGTGEFTVTYATAFKREPVVVAQAVGTRRVLIKASSSSAFTLQFTDAAGAAAEPTSFDFIVLGSDDAGTY